MKITNAKLRQIIKEELDNILNEAETGSIKSGQIQYASQEGVYNVGLNIRTGEKYTTGFQTSQVDKTKRINLRVPNLQLDKLDNVANNIARIADREGHKNIREEEVLAALESGKITLPR